MREAKIVDLGQSVRASVVRCVRLVALLVCLALSVTTIASDAEASFPGRNGNFAIALEGCEPLGNRYIRAYGPDGQDLGALTSRCFRTESQPDGLRRYRDTAMPDWAPNGKRLAYIHQRWTDSSRPMPYQLMTMAADGSDPKVVYSDSVMLAQPSFAPSGRHVAFVRGGSIWTIGRDGTGLRHLWSGPECVHADVTETFCPVQYPRWSPDGTLIAFSLRGDDHTGMWVIDSRTGEVVRRVAVNAFEMDWSPDSRALVYRTGYHDGWEDPPTRGGELFVTRVNGKGTRRLLRLPASAATVPRWSPDGRFIAYITLKMYTGGHHTYFSLWRMPASGGKPRRLTRLPSGSVTEAYYIAPNLAWQPRPRTSRSTCPTHISFRPAEHRDASAASCRRSR